MRRHEKETNEHGMWSLGNVLVCGVIHVCASAVFVDVGGIEDGLGVPLGLDLAIQGVLGAPGARLPAPHGLGTLGDGPVAASMLGGLAGICLGAIAALDTVVVRVAAMALIDALDTRLADAGLDAIGDHTTADCPHIIGGHGHQLTTDHLVLGKQGDSAAMVGLLSSLRQYEWT